MAGPILYVDDDHLWRADIQKQLKRFGHDIETASCIDDAYDRAQTATYSLFLVDFTLGNEDGVTLVMQLRASDIIVPIVIFAEEDDDLYATAALSLGADDYILKTTSIPLLVAKIEAHRAREERRIGQKKPATDKRRVVIGRFILDLHAHFLAVDETIVKVTKKETLLLEILFRNPTRTISFKAIMNHVWRSDHQVFRKSESALRTMVKRLRQKLDKEVGLKDLIENQHGQGLRLRGELIAHGAGLPAAGE